MPYDTLCLNHIIHLLRFHQLPVPLWEVHCGSTHPGFLLPTHPSSCHIFPTAQSIPYPWQRDLLLSSESCRGRWGSTGWGWDKETRLAADRNRICEASFSLLLDGSNWVSLSGSSLIQSHVIPFKHQIPVKTWWWQEHTQSWVKTNASLGDYNCISTYVSPSRPGY